jgi:sulfatase modifying factor 1
MQRAGILGILIAIGFVVTAIITPAQQSQPEYTNTIGMEFVLMQPGTMQVGVFHPTCPPKTQQFGGGFPATGRGNADAAPANSSVATSAPEPLGANTPVAQAGSATPNSSILAGGRGGPGPGPRPTDPRNQWTDADYARCEQLIQQESSEGFPVKIDRGYYVGKFEVTQAQWMKVMGKNPSIFQSDKLKDDPDNHPVENVTWQDTETFVKRLNALEKTKLYSLPTEFQWEYACRAGGPGQTSWNDIRRQGWVGDANYGTTHSVGTKQPNAWGIYDMIGNVWEWVQDPYNEKMFADPMPSKSGTNHVLKGGGFVSDVKNAICATHDGGPGNGWDVGFRLVRAVK